MRPPSSSAAVIGFSVSQRTTGPDDVAFFHPSIVAGVNSSLELQLQPPTLNSGSLRVLLLATLLNRVADPASSPMVDPPSFRTDASAPTASREAKGDLHVSRSAVDDAPRHPMQAPSRVEERMVKHTAAPAIRYPFWFGGSASCFAACVTHPLDLGKFCGAAKANAKFHPLAPS